MLALDSVKKFLFPSLLPSRLGEGWKFNNPELIIIIQSDERWESNFHCHGVVEGMAVGVPGRFALGVLSSAGLAQSSGIYIQHPK